MDLPAVRRFTAAPGGEVSTARRTHLAGRAYRRPLTVGYGKVYRARLLGQRRVDRNTNAGSASPPRPPEPDADHQVNAHSGRGMVRNYNGQTRAPTSSTTTGSSAAATGGRTRHLAAALVVVGLRQRLSTLNAGELTPDSLVMLHKTAYQASRHAAGPPRRWTTIVARQRVLATRRLIRPAGRAERNQRATLGSATGITTPRTSTARLRLALPLRDDRIIAGLLTTTSRVSA
ncbi:hypothetical protein K7G98_11630 [Saccharothrix sp. MB29]|nr:hypothetical protein [Saccharothrix sp. MB29]